MVRSVNRDWHFVASDGCKLEELLRNRWGPAYRDRVFANSTYVGVLRPWDFLKV